MTIPRLPPNELSEINAELGKMLVGIGVKLDEFADLLEFLKDVGVRIGRYTVDHNNGWAVIWVDAGFLDKGIQQ